MDFAFIFRLTQKDRLELEQAYLDRLRSLKRKREIIPHRETHELVMGGKKVIMCERYRFPLLINNTERLSIVSKTARLLPVSPSTHCSGGVPAQGGVLARGEPAQVLPHCEQNS